MEKVFRFIEKIIVYIIKKIFDLFVYLWKLSFAKKATLLIVIDAMWQLWISKYHIHAITKIFISYIGVYLFSFIIFGFVALFNATRIHNFLSKVITIFFTLLTALFGIIYVSIALSDQKVAYHEIQKSMEYTYIGIGLYLFAAFLLLISIVVDRKEK